MIAAQKATGKPDQEPDCGTSSNDQNGFDIITHTFGLEKEAETWLRDELQRSQESYLRQTPTYTPLQCKKDGKVPLKHMQEAFAEFARRFGRSPSLDKTPSVLLVATGVSEDWIPGDDVGRAGRARFLFFPKLGSSNTTALFITYMPGPEHGSVGKILADQIGAWSAANTKLSDYLTGGLSSGAPVNRSYRGFEPDHRIFPPRKYGDPQGRDSDGSNKGNPYSRFIWEIEYGNRDPVEIRQRGKLYTEPEYTRLFLAAKFYATLDDGTYEAAIILWGKPDGSNETTVMDAVSFGSKDLSVDHKNEFLKHRFDRLVGVQLYQWRRPQDNPAANWTIRVPFRGIGYKVAKKKRKRTQTIVYVLDEIEEGDVEDLNINLQDMVKHYAYQVLPAEQLSEVSSSEGDDN